MLDKNYDREGSVEKKITTLKLKGHGAKMNRLAVNSDSDSDSDSDSEANQFAAQNKAKPDIENIRGGGSQAYNCSSD
jgi:hypothetical protein